MDLPFDLPPGVFIVMFVIIVIAVVAFGSAAQQRRAGWAGGRICPSCGEPHPPFARFCRRCGTRL